MRDAASWLIQTGRDHSSSWQLEHLTVDALSNLARPDDFYVGLVNNKVTVAAILKTACSVQDWALLDQSDTAAALYVHYLAVPREFAGQQMARQMLDFANTVAQNNQCDRLRLDVSAHEDKLIALYQQLGFQVSTVIRHDAGDTALLERLCN